jgi:hypothetical protein
MFRHFWFVGTGVLALYGMLGAPGQLAAQRARGGSIHGFHSGADGFNARFHSWFFDPRSTRGRFDRFEDHVENRFRFGGIDAGITEGLALGFGFVPGFAGGFVPGLGFAPGFFGLVFP